MPVLAWVSPNITRSWEDAVSSFSTVLQEWVDLSDEGLATVRRLDWGQFQSLSLFVINGQQLGDVRQAECENAPFPGLAVDVESAAE